MTHVFVALHPDDVALVDASRSDDDRAEAARVFEILFRPGEIVDIARSTGT